MWRGEKKRITLKDDLTRYHSHLKPGVRGWLLPNVRVGEWGGFDHFGAVEFDCCSARLDVVLRGLDIEGAEADAAAREAKFREELKTTTRAILTVGPRGGFRSLSVEYSGGHLGIGFREKGERTLQILQEHGIKVERRVEPK
ncbi:MAG: hypothetical protein QOE90_185 [Thermoplasmata archaeon]|jgi:hypothetical protein|nr:hypothetical protein [Thermoplasmata archaeon]